MTDNAWAYRKSRLFADAVARIDAAHIFTRPYRPQTNGKVERFHQTLLRGWAYKRAYTSNQQRRQALPGFIEYYNRQRPHSSLEGQTPNTKLVNHLCGKDNKGAGRCPGVSSCWTVLSDERGRAGRRARRERRRHPLSVHPSCASRLTEQAPTPRKPEPIFLRTPWSSTYPTPRTRQEREKPPPPRPAPRAQPPPPPPEFRTRSVSTPEGRVRRMIPVSVCGPGGPEVLWLLHYPASV